jgi:hypothetical protein
MSRQEVVTVYSGPDDNLDCGVGQPLDQRQLRLVLERFLK